MAIGISKTFPLDLDQISRLAHLYSERPGAKPDEAGEIAGLNRPKVDGLNKLMGYMGLQQRRRLTPLGELVLNNDKYLRDLGTLAIFHYLLCSNEDAEVWHFASNRFIPTNRSFARGEFLKAIDDAGIGRGNTRLRADQALFLNAYTHDEYHALQPLGYLSISERQGEKYQARSVESVPALILSFALYQQRVGGVQTRTISISNLLTLDGQIGKIFLLRRESLMEKLRQLEARGVIGITQVADLDNVTFADIDDPLSLLTRYYQERS